MRERQETWNGSDREAQVMMAADAVAPWGKWTLVKRNDTTTLRRVRVLTLSEELKVDARRHLLDLTEDFIGGKPWPVDIDEWQARYDPLKALDTRLTQAGIDPRQIPLATRQALAMAMDTHFQGLLFFWGSPPGLLY